MAKQDSELDRVLSDIFGDPPPGAGLGEVDISQEGNYPEIAYPGGPQTQQRGLAGRRAASELFTGIDRKKCPPWMTEECLDVLSRMFETTFRNFQLHVRLPSHIQPPLRARTIDVFPSAVVNLPAGGYDAGAWVNVTTFQVPLSNRGVITGLGQTAESVVAWSNIAWRITVDGVPYQPYNDFRIQIGELLHPTTIGPINLRARQTVTLQAASLAAGTAYNVLGRLYGWHYETRAEQGDNVRSSLVD